MAMLLALLAALVNAMVPERYQGTGVATQLMSKAACGVRL